MTDPAIRVAVVCFSVGLVLFGKPLGRMTAAWQRRIGLGVSANETANRICYVVVGLIFLMLALWIT